jgi:hypothetical protein
MIIAQAPRDFGEPKTDQNAMDYSQNHPVIGNRTTLNWSVQRGQEATLKWLFS